MGLDVGYPVIVYGGGGGDSCDWNPSVLALQVRRWGCFHVTPVAVRQNISDIYQIRWYRLRLLLGRLESGRLLVTGSRTRRGEVDGEGGAIVTSRRCGGSCVRVARQP